MVFSLNVSRIPSTVSIILKSFRSLGVPFITILFFPKTSKSNPSNLNSLVSKFAETI
jgi:hypothetical protein